MKLYAFELGRKRELCLAELIAVFGEENLVESAWDTAIFRLKTMDEPQKVQNRLGGTIKTMEILGTAKSVSEFEPIIQKIIENEEYQGKIPFAISLFNCNFKDRKSIDSKKLLNFSKKIIKSLGFNCRFVNMGGQNPKSSTIYKAKVVEKGIDLNIIKGEKEFFIAKTVAIQNIDAYGIRDYEKPMRDAKVGMTPPKLAQIMINLAGPSDTIYDPFCGTGTFVMEALLVGKNAIGSDIEPRMVEYSDTNCNWLGTNFRVEKKWRNFCHDARFITRHELPEKIDAVVTEGYLGKAVFSLPSPQEREKTFRELENLHLNWLSAVGKLLKPGAKVVMCATAFRLPKNQLEHLPRFAELVKIAGYKIESRYIYDRAEQIVAREIFVLKKL